MSSQGKGPSANSVTQLTVTNGVPSPDPATIPTSTPITVQNNDDTDYLVELFTNGNDKHVAIAVILPANGSFQFESFPGENANQKCYYNVIAVQGRPTADSGTHVIVIGN